MTGMVGSGSRIPLASVIRGVRPIGGGLAAGRRPRPERSGILVAVACVATAIVLYAVVSLVGSFADDVGDGPFGAMAIERTGEVAV
jgi:hypothetical protein